MDTKEQDLLKITEAAQLLGVARRTVYRRIWNGELPASKVGGLYFIRRVDIEAMLEKGRRHSPKEMPTAKEEPPPLKCSVCFRILENDSQVGDLCKTGGCDKVICQQCWSQGVRHCTQHIPDRDEKWRKAQEAFQKGKLPLLVKASHARLQEISFLNRIETRIHNISTLSHPLTEEVLTISDWEEYLETGDKRAEVMRLLGRMVLDKTTTEQIPLNVWARWDLPLAKRQKGLPVRVFVQVLSRLPEMLRDGFDSQPLTGEYLTKLLLQSGEEVETDGVVSILVLASLTGWDEDALTIIHGDASGTAFAHRHLLVYLYDLQNGNLIYNQQDKRLLGYTELFTTLLPEEELKEVVAAIEKEFRTHGSLSLKNARNALPYSDEMIDKAFKCMISTGNYILTEIPDFGKVLVQE